MKSNVFKKARSNVGLAPTLVMLLLMSGCAHDVEDLNPDLIAADKKCSLQRWATLIEMVDCNDSAEMPVIKNDVPIALQAFEIFSSKRKLLAQKFDDERAPILESWNRFKQKDNEAMEVLMAHEPQYKDKDSLLNKEILSADLDKACTSQVLVDRTKCYDSIMRPIWEREAPDTIEYYDEFQKKRLQSSKEYDAIGAQNIWTSINDRFHRGMKKAVDEFVSDARRAIQQQRTDEAQATAEQARRNAQQLNLVGEFAQDFLEGATIAAQVRANAAPVATQTIQEQPKITHTTCQMVFNQMQCTNMPY